MAEILRTWNCLNARCGSRFDAWAANPACPSCGCVRVSWVPGAVHTAGVSKGADVEFRTLADTFGLTDLHSARRDEHAKPRVVQQPVDRSAPVHNFGGFAAQIDPTRAQCVPTVNNVNFKVGATVGAPLSKSRTVPGVHAGTAIEASYRPPR